ncbi:hypothetical protein LCGC14_1012910 [marine sediment metagenome]|uniref:Uncharacterized protein n=1 Tax=marine sediment metagenome TaxID=412755 RepID=A0A0F9NL90_9ZZZZ
MIITRTPLRISFFGGGTDYPQYFNEHGGAVLATAIDKYIYVANNNGKIWWHSDLPMRSGMATSSAYTVGLLKASSHKTNEEIAEIATFWESQKLDGNVGVQDQYLCAKGGFHRLRFFASGIVDEVVDYKWLEPYLMLVDSGQYRSGSVFSQHQLDRVSKNLDVLQRIKEMALVDYKDYESFGLALNKAWQLKKSLAEDVTTPFTDDIFAKAIKAGAIGGKQLGAGGGGFMIFVVEPDKQDAVRNVLHLNEIPFKFESKGSEVIYADS